MLSEREQELARLAIRHRYLTGHQLTQFTRGSTPLEQALVDHGYLTAPERDELLKLVGAPQPCSRCGYQPALSHAPDSECPQCESSAVPVARIGPYALREEIGRGSSGTVYLATRGGAEVALKVLASDDPRWLERCLDRSRHAAVLRHPNLAQVLDAGRDGAGVYVASEFVHAVSLRDHVHGSIRLPLDESIPILKQVASALGEIHRAGLLHENLTPDNVLVADTREVKVTDPGLGRDVSALAAPDGRPLRLAGSVAPERWEGRALPAGDLYACGVLWYLMLTGEPPHKAPTLAELRRRHAETLPPAPSRKGPGLPAAADAVFSKLTLREPGLRYASADALRADLDRLEDGKPTLAERELPAARRATRRSKRA